MPPLTLHYSRGAVFLPDLGLWLDPHDPQPGPELVFVSHAHADHIGAHRELILTPPTSKLMAARLSGERIEHTLPFGERRAFKANAQPFDLTLFPAGHIFGSAMALIEFQETRILYTGDFKLRPGLSAEPCQPVAADILIMETTYGLPRYKFPPTDQVMRGVVEFCKEALNNGETPVLLGYSLGKSQEILCALGDAQLPIAVHSQVHKLTKIYEEFGRCFPPYEKYDGGVLEGKVLLCPPSGAGTALLKKVPAARVATLTGWAMDPGCQYRSRAHAAFPLSDHADFDGLVDMVKRVAPKKVYTLHGFAAEFAQSLSSMGYDAEPLTPDDQLTLALQTGVSNGSSPSQNRKREQYYVLADAASAITPPQPAVTPGELGFETFAHTCVKVGSTPKKLEKIKTVADYLKSLAPQALEPVVTWFIGKPFPPVQNKPLQLGWAIIRDALCAVAKIDQDTFGQYYLKHSDLGETAAEILEQCPATPEQNGLSIAQAQELFSQLYSSSGPRAKLPVFVRALSRSSPIEGKYLVKILTGDLRIGLKEGLVEEAIAQAFALDLDRIKYAHLLLGDLAETALLAKSGELQSAAMKPFRPVKYMLASPEETANDIYNRVRDWSGAAKASNGSELCGALAWIEDKYDGVRAQVHKAGFRVAIFSRDLRDITTAFQELADDLRAADGDFVLDGEIVGMRGSEILPFGELQKRLGRREGDLFLPDEIPVRFIAFDLLWRDDRTLLDAPLRERRSELETLKLPARFLFSRVTQASAAEEIEEVFAAAKFRGNEGLMIKDPDSPYSPGRRGLSWLKLKKAYATLDCVVVGAEFGHGKRKAVLSDYTFAVRDEVTGQLLTIGKAYSGLTDAEIARLTQRFFKSAKEQRGRYFEVEPEVVLEIAFDAIQSSSRHGSGLALRFPRILRIREDKTVADIDTLAAAQALVPAPAPKPAAVPADS